VAGIDAFGTTLARESDSTPGTYIAIGNVTSLSPPGISRETLDVTAHDSPDGWMEFLGGLKDGGEVSFDVNYDPAKHDDLLADFQADDPVNWKVTFPDTAATEWTFPGILTGFEPDAPYDDKLAASLTLKVAGKPTIDGVAL
jgi:predicted secreted protein